MLFLVSLFELMLNALGQSTAMFMQRRCLHFSGRSYKISHGIQNVLQIYSAKLITQHRFILYVMQVNFISTGLDCRVIDTSKDVVTFCIMRLKKLIIFLRSKRKQFVLKLTSRISQEAHATKITALANLFRAQWSTI